MASPSAIPASPPPTRGSTHTPSLQLLTAVVSPAYAGIDLLARSLKSVGPCLPRLRGDRPACWSALSPATASPPPTRGSTREECAVLCEKHVSPAYAGIDLARAWTTCRCRRLPRLRGDRPFQTHDEATPCWSPPPTRGSTWRLFVSALSDAVSPAYAGIDPSHG